MFLGCFSKILCAYSFIGLWVIFSSSPSFFSSLNTICPSFFRSISRFSSRICLPNSVTIFSYTGVFFSYSVRLILSASIILMFFSFRSLQSVVFPAPIPPIMPIVIAWYVFFSFMGFVVSNILLFFVLLGFCFILAELVVVGCVGFHNNFTLFKT